MAGERKGRRMVAANETRELEIRASVSTLWLCATQYLYQMSRGGESTEKGCMQGKGIRRDRRWSYEEKYHSVVCPLSK